MPTVLDFTPTSDTTGTVSLPAKTVSAGSAIVVFAFCGGSPTATVSDGVNTYTQRRMFTDSTYYRLYMWTAENVAAGSTTITITQSGSIRYFLHAYELTGVPTSGVFDAQDAFTDNSTTQYAAGVSGITVASGATALSIFFQDRTNSNTQSGWASVSAAASAGGWFPYVSTKTFAGGASGERATVSASSGGAYVAGLISIKASGGTSATASGVTVTSAASIVVGSASGQLAGTASGVTFTAAGSLVAGSASGVINGTLNFQAAGFEFGRRTGSGISTFALDNGASYRYTIHADALTLGSALHTSAAITLDSAGKLPNYVGSAVAPGTQYRIVAIRQADGEAATFRVTAT